MEHQTLGRRFICPIGPAIECKFILDWRISVLYCYKTISRFGRQAISNQAAIWKLSGSQQEVIRQSTFNSLHSFWYWRKAFSVFLFLFFWCNLESRVGGNLFIPLFKPWDRNYTAETFTFQFTVSNLFQTVSRLGPETKKFLSLT